MTQEDKALLLKDLCARLPYRVKVNVKGVVYGNRNRGISICIEAC